MKAPHEFTALVYDRAGQETQVNVWYSPLDEIHVYNYANSEDITRELSQKQINRVAQEYREHCDEFEASLDFTVSYN